MKLSHALLTTLADGHFHSGTELGAKTGRTRAAVWKAIQALQASGLEVFSVRGKGYRLAQPLELLSHDAILQHLGAAGRAGLARLDLFDDIASTNAYLLELAKQGELSGYACGAEQQHAGRGRRGREWVSPPGGNIYLSLLWCFQSGVAQLGGLSLAMGLAVTRALADIGLAEARLKWPNDILVGQRKLAGVLLEMTGEAAGPCSVVIGIGLNVRAPAGLMAGIEQPWTDLASVLPGRTLPRNRLVGRLLEHMIDVIRQFEQQGFQSLQPEWNRRDACADQPVELQLPDRRVRGIARGVDTSGALLLLHDDAVQRFHSGEISLRVCA
jgi:BirA family biotin operon repressor/biotin-[acetyl-CoA-carboxylase] ligase